MDTPAIQGCLRSMPRTMAGQLLLDLPSELVSQDVLSKLDYLDLLRAGMTCKRLRSLAPCNKLWRKLFEDKWGEVSAMHEAAAKLAGGFLSLYRSKHVTDANGNGWSRPCEFELRAVLLQLAQRAMTHAAAAAASDKRAAAAACGTTCNSDTIPSSPTSLISAASAVLSHAPSTSSTASTQPTSPPAHHSTPLPSFCDPDMMMMGCELEVLGDAPPTRAPAPEVQLVYLLDGSGSVSEEDFNEMRKFVVTSAPILTEALGAGPLGKVGVVQFSTDTRVEMPLSAIGDDPNTLRTALDAIMRINGGTNIATAIAKAGSMMKADDQMRAAAAAVAAAASSSHASPRASLPGSPTSAHVPRSPMVFGMGPGSPTASPARAAAVAAGATTLAVPITMRSPPAAMPQWPAPPATALGSYSRDARMTGAEDRPSAFMETTSGNGAGGSIQQPVICAATHATPTRPLRMVLLLTDGRVDTYQAREARTTACRLCDELCGCTLAAFGVGRGVDRTELLHIIDTQQGDAGSRYMDLYTRDDSPW